VAINPGKSWTTASIKEGASDPISRRIAFVKRSLKLEYKKGNLSTIEGLVQELDRIDQFVTMRGDIVTNIMLGRSRLPKAKDETGNIENFYKYETREWVAYFFVDEYFRNIVSVFSIHASEPPPVSLRATLNNLMEKFRQEKGT